MSAYSNHVLGLFRSDAQSGERCQEQRIHVDIPGIESDKHFGKRAERSILVTTRYSYEKAARSGIDMPFGSLGENIVLDIDPQLLKRPGSRLKIGSAILEIVQNCTICKSLANVDDSLPELLRDDRGVFARCLQKGIISAGDTAELL